jgi:hypothetical protein
VELTVPDVVVVTTGTLAMDPSIVDLTDAEVMRIAETAVLP